MAIASVALPPAVITTHRHHHRIQTPLFSQSNLWHPSEDSWTIWRQSSISLVALSGFGHPVLHLCPQCSSRHPTARSTLSPKPHRCYVTGKPHFLDTGAPRGHHLVQESGHHGHRPERLCGAMIASRGATIDLSSESAFTAGTAWHQRTRSPASQTLTAVERAWNPYWDNSLILLRQPGLCQYPKACNTCWGGFRKILTPFFVFQFPVSTILNVVAPPSVQCQQITVSGKHLIILKGCHPHTHTIANTHSSLYFLALWGLSQTWRIPQLLTVTITTLT